MNAFKIKRQIRLYAFRQRLSALAALFKLQNLTGEHRTVLANTLESLGSFYGAAQAGPDSTKHPVLHRKKALYAKFCARLLDIRQHRNRTAGEQIFIFSNHFFCKCNREHPVNTNRTVIGCNRKILCTHILKAVRTALKRSKEIIRSIRQGRSKVRYRCHAYPPADDTYRRNTAICLGKLFCRLSVRQFKQIPQRPDQFHLVPCPLAAKFVCSRPLL